MPGSTPWCCRWCCITPRTRRRPRRGRAGIAARRLLIVIDLAAHARDDLTARLAHRWPGFSDASMVSLLKQARLTAGSPATVAGPLDVRLWPATPVAAKVSAAKPKKELA